jgi:hypothetical protein
LTRTASRARRRCSRSSPGSARPRELACRRSAFCELKKWTDAALSYNGLVIAWPELTKLMPAARSRRNLDATGDLLKRRTKRADQDASLTRRPARRAGKHVECDLLADATVVIEPARLRVRSFPIFSSPWRIREGLK